MVIVFYLTIIQNNVLLDEDYIARLSDFGYASLVGNIPEALTYLQRSTARPGALRWIAPEQIESEETFSRTIKSDIYSFGCVALQGGLLDTDTRSVLIFLQVLSGKQPWSEVQQDAPSSYDWQKAISRPDQSVQHCMTRTGI